MPVYFLTGKYSTNTISVNDGLSSLTTSTGGSLTQNFTLLVSEVLILYFMTSAAYPNNNNFTTTSSLLTINHPTANMSVNLVAQLHRVNNSGTIQASGTASATTTALAQNTFATLDDPTWSTNCSDRILLQLTYTNTSSMVENTFGIGLHRLTSYLNSSIPINGGTCPVLRKRHKVTTISKK